MLRAQRFRIPKPRFNPQGSPELSIESQNPCGACIAFGSRWRLSFRFFGRMANRRSKEIDQSGAEEGEGGCKSMNEREGETNQPTERPPVQLASFLLHCFVVLCRNTCNRRLPSSQLLDFQSRFSPTPGFGGMVCEIVFAVADTPCNFPSSKLFCFAARQNCKWLGKRSGVVDPSAV